MPKFAVTYEYNGGSATTAVTSADDRAATAAVMAAATPKWASDPATPCRHIRTSLLTHAAHVAQTLNEGLRSAAFGIGGPQDTGGAWLVVRRRTWGANSGDVMMHDYLFDDGQVVAVADSRAAAEQAARPLLQRNARAMTGYTFTVIRRSAVIVEAALAA